MIRFQKQLICEQAIAEITKGNPDALCDIYKSLGKQIFALAISILRDYQLSEDVMQETFVKISEKAHTYRKGSNVIAWILSITRNLALDEYRRRRHEFSNANIDDIEGEYFYDEVPFEELEALSVLNTEEIQIVFLKVYSRLKHKEIAEMLGITTYSAEKKYQRSIAKLRAYYYYNEEEESKWNLKEN